MDSYQRAWKQPNRIVVPVEVLNTQHLGNGSHCFRARGTHWEVVNQIFPSAKEKHQLPILAATGSKLADWRKRGKLAGRDGLDLLITSYWDDTLGVEQQTALPGEVLRKSERDADLEPLLQSQSSPGVVEPVVFFVWENFCKSWGTHHCPHSNKAFTSDWLSVWTLEPD